MFVEIWQEYCVQQLAERPPWLAAQPRLLVYRALQSVQRLQGA